MNKDYNNLKINKKRRSSINLNIHDSKVFSSVYRNLVFFDNPENSIDFSQKLMISVRKKI